MKDYAAFLAERTTVDHGDGFKVAESDINPQLFDFQRAIVAWACEKGRAAIFADCGLGKTPIQLEWARLVCERHGGIVLIVAPLAVAEQTAREGDKFGVPGERLPHGDDVTARRQHHELRDAPALPRPTPLPASCSTSRPSSRATTARRAPRPR